jgi:hypothetical protein
MLLRRRRGGETGRIGGRQWSQPAVHAPHAHAHAHAAAPEAAAQRLGRGQVLAGRVRGAPHRRLGQAAGARPPAAAPRRPGYRGGLAGCCAARPAQARGLVRGARLGLGIILLVVRRRLVFLVQVQRGVGLLQQDERGRRRTKDTVLKEEERRHGERVLG